LVLAYNNNLQQHEIFEGEDPQSILNRAAFQGDLIQVKNILSNNMVEKIEIKQALKLSSIRGYYEIVKLLLEFYTSIKPLIKLLWFASINLRSTVVEYLLFSINLKKDLPIADVQKLLLRIGTKFNVSEILKKDLPILCNTMKDNII